MTRDPEGLGSLAEEAARLVEAVQDWLARGREDEASANRFGEALHNAFGRDHLIADDSPACRLCPVCQLIALLRQARPETFAHLLDASAAFHAALRSLVEPPGREPRPGGVQRIDLDPPGGPRTATFG